MATARFANPNTESAKGAALASFDRFLAHHQVARANVFDLIAQDATGQVLGRTLDQYALYLVAAAGARGRRLEQSTVTQYFRTVKAWLLDQYPLQEELIRRRMKKTSASLKTRFKVSSQQCKQAPSCSKTDLRGLVDVIYQTASSEVEYHDAALLILMWYLLGRSSDMAFLTKHNITVHSGGVLSLRFGWIKTGVDQGLALFGSKDALSCPIHALAILAATERVPSDVIFRYLPKPIVDTAAEIDYPEDLLLSEMLQEHIEREAVSRGTVKGGTIHSYVNRTLRRIVELAAHSNAPFSKTLTSHSFRRGGAQAANAHSKISLQWILDRGGWQLSSLNRGFIYIVNTTTEDQQVAKVLSGWEPDHVVWQPTLNELDPPSRSQIAQVRACLFASERDHAAFAFKDDVLDLFMAHVIYHYPAEMAWAKAHQDHKPVVAAPLAAVAPPDCKIESLLGQQVDLIRNLVQQNTELQNRLRALERRMDKNAPQAHNPDVEVHSDAADVDEAPENAPAIKRRRAASKSLLDVWMMWYTLRPPLYEDKAYLLHKIERQRFSEYKTLTAYMRLFIHNGYTICTGSGNAAEARRIGAEAEKGVLRKLAEYGARGSSYGTVLKTLKQLYSRGALDDLIEVALRRVREGKIVDPTPLTHLLPGKKINSQYKFLS